MDRFDGNHRRHRRRGAAAVFTVIILMVLLGFTALTVDVGYMYNVRAELQNAADAAALAGIQSLPDEPLALQSARDYANMNYSQHGAIVSPSDVELGNWNWDTSTYTAGGNPVNAVHVFATRSAQNGNAVSLFFAPIFGKHSTDISASATAAMGRAERWDVVIAQDVTGSFTNEIDEARLADQDLLDCINTNAPDTMLGLITFTGYGQTMTGLKNVNAEYTSLSSQIGAIDDCDEPGMPPCSGTNIGAGLDQAISVLNASSSGGVPKAIILVSDGMPNSGIPGYSDSDLEDWAEASADNADALGISIFTLFFSGNSTTPGAADFLAGLVRGDGIAVETDDPTEISDKLQEICKSGMKAMLVR